MTVFVLDVKAGVKTILSVEDDFNVALDKVVKFLSAHEVLDVEDACCLGVRDILLLKRWFDFLHSPAAVEVECVAPRTLLSFCEVEGDGSS